MQYGAFSLIYFFFMSSLASGALVWAHLKFREDAKEHKIAMNLTMLALTTGWIGGRLLHVFWESPFAYRQRPYLIFYFWQGGFVYYGGVIAASLAALIYLKLKQESFSAWADKVTPLINMGYGVGRIGCFISGCCYGKETDWPWAVNGLHPTQLYSFFWELFVFLFMRSRLKKTPKAFEKTGVFFGVYVLLHSIGRFWIESYRADFRGLLYHGYSISAYISILSLIFALIWIPARLVKKK